METKLSRRPSVGNAEKITYEPIELARGLAALAVVVSHARAFVMNDYGPHASSVAGRVFYLLSGMGHSAVIVFFVLSGFLIAKSVEVHHGTGKPWRKYAAARLSRLWIVLIPCLLLTLVLDCLGAAFGQKAFYLGNAAYYHSGPGLAGASHDLTTFVANVLFLQTVAAPVFGSNGPLWSLANEFWYYVIFPVGYVASRKLLNTRPWLGDIAVGLFIFLLGLVSGSNILKLYPAWLAGWGAMKLSNSLGDRALNAVSFYAVATIAALAIVIHSVMSENSVFGDLFLAMALSIALGVIAKFKLPIFVERLGRMLATPSYSLYLSHFPLMAAMAAIGLQGRRMNFTWESALIVTLFVIASAVVALALYYAFERKTAIFRVWLEFIFGVREVSRG